MEASPDPQKKPLIGSAASYSKDFLMGKSSFKMSEPDLQRKIARILAQRYYDGTKDRHKIADMDFEAYMAQSMEGWISTARGVISLIRQNSP